jgi:hypothetical protein
MKVAELIAEFQGLPQGYEVFVATSQGEEPFWTENMIVSSRRGKIIIAQTDEDGEPVTAESLEIKDEELCQHADECMHFQRVRRRPFLRQHVRDRNLAQIAKAEGRQ